MHKGELFHKYFLRWCLPNFRDAIRAFITFIAMIMAAKLEISIFAL